MTNAELGAIINLLRSEHDEDKYVLESVAWRTGEPIHRISAVSAYITTHRGQTPKD